MLTAVYDFRRCPLTFDFIVFLAITCTISEKVHILFVPDDQTPDGFKQAKFPTEQRAWRLRNLILPLCGLYGVTYTLCPNREFARPLIERAEKLYPKGYTLENPVYLYDLPTLTNVVSRTGFIFAPRASEQARLYVKHTLGDEPYFTVTQRKSTRWPTRDSNTDAWQRFVSSRNERFIQVADLDSSRQPWNVNIDLRMALYENAALNLGVNNGPMALCWYGTSPYLTLKILDETCPAASAEYLAKQGLPEGSQLPWANPRQKLVWKPDTYENITEAFEEIMN